MVHEDNINSKKFYVNTITFSLSDNPNHVGISIYFQGCDRTLLGDGNKFCPECHNPQTWYPYENENNALTITQILNIIERKLEMLFMKHNKISINYVGGEPLAKYNKNAVKELSKILKEKYGNKLTHMLYSWRYPLFILKHDLEEYIENIDEFCLGPFMNKYKNSPDVYPSSKNQKYYTSEDLKTVLNILKNKSILKV